MTTPPTLLPPQFKRGEGYFSLRTIKDSSGHTVIAHPKAETSSKPTPTSGPRPSAEPQGPLDRARPDDDIFPGELGVGSRSALSRHGSTSSLLEGSLSPVTPLASDEEDEACLSNPPINNDRRQLSGVITPISVDVLDPESPYDNCHRIRLYNGKPDQYWYYTWAHSLINSPPKVPHHRQIQRKALFICDVIGNKGRYIERQVWVNNGEKKAKWDIAQGVNAVQTISGKEYGFYVNENGPHWVQKDTLTRLNRRMLY